MNKNTLIIIGVVVLIVGLLSSGRILGGNPPGGDATPSRHGAAAVRASATDGDPSKNIPPDFTLTTLDGETITLSEYAGEKAVVLDFFATWCPNCRRDMPRLNKMYEEHKDQIEVIGINLQESSKKVRKYIDDTGITFPIVLDPSGSVSRDYGIRYTNFHVLINKAGEVVGVVPGDISERDVLSLIEADEEN